MIDTIVIPGSAAEEKLPYYYQKNYKIMEALAVRVGDPEILAIVGQSNIDYFLGRYQAAEALAVPERYDQTA